MTDYIGNSGFEYTESVNKEKAGKGRSKAKKRTVIVRDKITKEAIFTLIGSDTIFRDGHSYSNPVKTFFGLDGRYYHIMVSHNRVTWGQVQSDGAVINKNRTIIKHLNFYPMEVTKTTIPTTPINVPQPIITAPTPPPVIPVSSPKLEVSIQPITKIVKTDLPEVSWYKKIINWMNQIMDRLINLINR